MRSGSRSKGGGLHGSVSRIAGWIVTSALVGCTINNSRSVQNVS